MTKERFRLTWLKGEASGYSDVFLLEDFREEISAKELLHSVEGPRGGHHKARCLVHIKKRQADLDYTQFREENKRNGMYIGIMRLQFFDECRRHVLRVLWKNERTRDFQEQDETDVQIRYSSGNELTAERILESLKDAVAKSLKSPREERLKRLASADRKSKSAKVLTTVFIRNPDVVAEVLYRANGKCENCRLSAPFIRVSDNTPYLEVHHRKRLTDGGEDTVENAVALCPNCHRNAHFGHGLA